jgi:hypothetical protein
MESQRVFDIANEAMVDTRTAIGELQKLGSDITEPTKRLDADMTRRLRRALGLPVITQGVGAGATVAPKVPIRGTNAQTKRPPSRLQRTIRPMPKAILSPEHADAVRGIIPDLYNLLLHFETLPSADGVVVIYHDARLRPEYGLCGSSRERWMPTGGSGTLRDALLAPLREIDRRYRDRALMPPNTFITIDVPNKRAWFDRTLHKRPTGPYLDATTLQAIPEVVEGPPARLAVRAQMFNAEHVPTLVRGLSNPEDRPEEAFLLHEELLQLAVDSLDSDPQLDPLPVHINGLWVFARPVIMRRPDGSERHVRAVWYRQGKFAWRMRTFAAGIGNEPKEVGDRLAGRLPFVPVWDESRPEQKLVAAVWALMAQGGVTESHHPALGGGTSTGVAESGDLTVVRVKAGTNHAQVYRSDDPSNVADRPAWTVRGHWRRQPYPSLGLDEQGMPATKMKWIASYVKGNASESAPLQKVIVVRP